MLRRWRQWRMSRAVLRAREDRAYAGRLGEREAARYLKREKGFSVLLKNWRHGHGELDLVCSKADTLIFVEVRARKAEALVSGFHSLTAKKREILQKTCKAYLKGLRKRPQSMRFDVVEIRYYPDGAHELHHFEHVQLFEN